MNNALEKIFIQLNNSFDGKALLLEKINLISSKFSLDGDKLSFFYIGILYDFSLKNPLNYHNIEVAEEVIRNLKILHQKDEKIFLDTFLKNIDKFFYALNSYHSILDLYDEFDDIGIEETTKAKIYYIPLITHLMEYCLNHFYRGIASIEGTFKDKDYTKQNTLGQLKNILVSNYPNLLDININFRAALSHGMLDIRNEKTVYSYTEKGTYNTISKELEYYELNDIKNNLLDTASGAFLGLFLFMAQKEIITNTHLNSMSEKTIFEFFKLFLHNENIKVKSYSKDSIGSSQFKIYINIQNINEKNQLIHLLILVSKVMYISFPNYEGYIIDYTHPYSIGGMVSFEHIQLQEIIRTDDISELDRIMNSGESLFLIPNIQETFQDNRSYKLHTFPKINGIDWEVIQLKDISNESTKRFIAKLIINKKSISEDEVLKLILQVTKRVRLLENKQDLSTKIKYGKVEADIVRLEVFYRPNKRNQFYLLSNNKNFICLTQYYKRKSIPRIEVGFYENYTLEKVKKIDIFWNKEFVK